MSIERLTSFCRSGWGRLLLIVFPFFVPNAGSGADRPRPSDTWIILYDSTGSFGWIGGLHAKLLSNLLGHFPEPYEIRAVEGYRAGDISHAKGAFYLGTIFNNPLPRAFLEDVLNTTRPVCWFKYNLLQLAQLDPAAFEARFGFRFEFIDASGFSNITYKGESFSKSMLDPDVGRVTVLNPTVAREFATAWRSDSNSAPYVIRGGNLWYVGDSPFTYMSEEDRYLIFADLLHDIVQIPHNESHRAIIRLEDIDPTYPPELLRRAADFLANEEVPFAVAVVPVYADPSGFYNGGIPERVAMIDTPEFVETLRYMTNKGAQLVLHGYTHQYAATNNPFTGVSGDDYEFFRVVLDSNANFITYAPVPEDSANWARSRVNGALRELRLSGFEPVAWETPHYAASDLDYPVFAENFALTIQRVLYFDSAGHSAGQFFPYVIERDFYGQKIIPENLGNVDLEWWFHYPPRFPEDIVRAARKNRVVRDGWASAFFHPYLPLSYLEEVVDGIRGLGYMYVPVSNPMAPLITVAPSNVVVHPGATARIIAKAVGTPPLTFRWQFNGRDIPGATSSTLTITNSQASNAGNYQLFISSSVANAITPVVTLKVVSPFRMMNTRMAGTTLIFSFASQNGVTYALERTSEFGEGWTVARRISGTGASVEVREAITPGSNFFYRIRAE